MFIVHSTIADTHWGEATNTNFPDSELKVDFQGSNIRYSVHVTVEYVLRLYGRERLESLSDVRWFLDWQETLSPTPVHLSLLRPSPLDAHPNSPLHSMAKRSGLSSGVTVTCGTSFGFRRQPQAQAQPRTKRIKLNKSAKEIADKKREEQAQIASKSFISFFNLQV